MSVRNRVRSEVLKLRSARLEATGGNGQARAQIPRFGLMERIQTKVQGQQDQQQGRGVSAARGPGPGAPQFAPKIPILSIFMSGSRPRRETAGRLISSTNQAALQLQEDETPPPGIICLSCEASNVATAIFCQSCGVDLSEAPQSRYKTGSSRGISVDI